MHLLDRSGPNFRIALHIAVPGTNNGAGVAWATALVNSGSGGTTALRDGDGTAGTISAAEKASIVAGTVLEVVDTVNVAQNGTGAAAITAFLDDYYVARSAEVLAVLQARLNQFGRVR